MDEVSEAKAEAGEKLEPPEAPATLDHNDRTMLVTESDGTEGQDRESYTDDQDRESYEVPPEVEPLVEHHREPEDLTDPPAPLRITEPPVDVGMMVRMQRGREEVPALVMRVYDDEVVDLIQFSMTGPSHVRPMERMQRTPPGNGGWWHEWEGR